MILITENTKDFKRGQLVQEDLVLVTGAVINENVFIPKKAFVYLTEELTKKDEDRIRKIVAELMKKFFWRIYTRSSFVLN